MIKMKEESEAVWLLSKKVYKEKKGAQEFSRARGSAVVAHAPA